MATCNMLPSFMNKSMLACYSMIVLIWIVSISFNTLEVKASLLLSNGRDPTQIPMTLLYPAKSTTSLSNAKTEPSILPPTMPVRFYNQFEMYYTPRDDSEMPLPPWPTAHPPQLPYAIGRGETWYAADLGIMIERYEDYCVPIFEPNSYFPCVLFNYGGAAYFISDNKTTGYGPCCVYRKPWAPPHRDFMQQFTMYYNKSTTRLGPGILEQTIDWWTIPLDAGRSGDGAGRREHMRAKWGSDEHPVFGGYGWARSTIKSGYRSQVCFWYEGNVGWAQQLFYNFVDHGPEVDNLDQFRLPEICNTAVACLYRP